MSGPDTLEQAAHLAAELCGLDPGMVAASDLNNREWWLNYWQEIIKERLAKLAAEQALHPDEIPGMLGFEDPIPDRLLAVAIQQRDRIGEGIVSFVTRKRSGYPLYPPE